MSPENRQEEYGGHEDVFVARQPIFDRKEHVWGYELLFRTSATALTAEVADPDMATAKVIADGFVLAHSGMEPGQRALINFPEKLLLRGAVLALPKDICVVEIQEDLDPRPEVLKALRAIKRAGYTLAMDDYAGEPKLTPFLDLVDIIKVDVLKLGSDENRIRRVAKDLKKYNCPLLAEKVEVLDIFGFTKDLGFGLFQGFFFKKPKIIPGKKISAGKIAKIRLLHELGKPDFEFKRLSEVFHTDPSLSYRLFQYINSVGMGVRHKVESVTRALTLLGQRQLVQWLRAVLMIDLSPSKKAEELAFISVHRARFLELVAENTDACHRSPEAMFLLGLFSLLDAMLGHSMREVMGQISLDLEIKSALIGEKNELWEWLRLLNAYERGHWEYVFNALSKKDLEMEKIDRHYVQAMAWTQRTLGNFNEEEEEEEEGAGKDSTPDPG
ncbi:MAG: HDOD domain-containing protein [Thermodesulfobacteriota bacterium]|nr:HDOD domain-containing protein [Thermodesulfobacteriota bacterium]